MSSLLLKEAAEQDDSDTVCIAVERSDFDEILIIAMPPLGTSEFGKAITITLNFEQARNMALMLMRATSVEH